MKEFCYIFAGRNKTKVKTNFKNYLIISPLRRSRESHKRLLFVKQIIIDLGN